MKQIAWRGCFHDTIEIHHRHNIAGMGNDREIVADEEKRQAQIFLKRFQQVVNVCLDRHIKRRNAFIGDDIGRFRHQRAGDRDALSLPTRKGVGKAPEMFDIQPAFPCDLAHRFVGFRKGFGHPQAERSIMVLKDELRAMAEVFFFFLSIAARSNRRS